jgi:hypothetical protein
MVLEYEPLVYDLKLSNIKTIPCLLGLAHNRFGKVVNADKGEILCFTGEW